MLFGNDSNRFTMDTSEGDTDKGVPLCPGHMDAAEGFPKAGLDAGIRLSDFAE